jgi:hypothetical protein
MTPRESSASFRAAPACSLEAQSSLVKTVALRSWIGNHFGTSRPTLGRRRTLTMAEDQTKWRSDAERCRKVQAIIAASESTTVAPKLHEKRTIVHSCKKLDGEKTNSNRGDILMFPISIG